MQQSLSGCLGYRWEGLQQWIVDSFKHVWLCVQWGLRYVIANLPACVVLLEDQAG